eukprot:gene7885-8081_t
MLASPAEICLQKYRFSIKFKGVEAKLMYAAIDKDRVYGPFSLQFQVIIKNLSEEVDARMLYDLFIPYGEIYQCKVDNDMYNQHYGQLTFMDVGSVQPAVHHLNQTRWNNSVIVVEPHHKAHLSLNMSGPPPAAPSVSSTADFPSLGNGSSSGAAVTRRLSNSGSVGASSSVSFHQPPLPPARPSPQQQQQQHPVFESAAVNFALSASSTGFAAPTPFPQPVTPPSARSARDGSAAAFPGGQDLSTVAAYGNDHLVTGAGLAKAIGAPGSAVGTPRGAGGGGVGKKVKGGILKSVISSFEQLSDMLCCPITHEVFQDPVLAADGITYERAAITHWLSGHDTSPMTNIPLPSKDIQPNTLVKAIVKELM